MKRVNSDELGSEAQAAFGRDTEVVELEPDDLAEPTPTRYPMEDEIEVGDHVVIGSKRHDDVVQSGTVTEVKSYAMELEPDESGSGYFGFDGFGGERGTMFTIEQINGQDVDVEYGEVEIDE